MRETFDTARLAISRLNAADAEDLVRMLMEPALYDVIGDAPESPAAAGIRVARWTAGSSDPAVGWINHVARLRGDGQLIGSCQATVSGQDRPRAEECLLAYLVHPAHQNRGYASEMMPAFRDQVCECFDPLAVTAYIEPGHRASEKVAMALGLSVTSTIVDGEREWHTER